MTDESMADEPTRKGPPPAEPPDTAATPATGRTRVPDPGGASDATPATGRVVRPDAEARGWPGMDALSWARAPAVPPAAEPPPAATLRPRRRRWVVPLAFGLLVALLVAGGGAGFLAGSLRGRGSTPRAAPTLRPTRGPIGVVDTPLISLTLPPGWLELEQSRTEVWLVSYPTGSMDISVRTVSGATTPQTVLQQREQVIAGTPGIVGSVTTCARLTAHVIAGRSGFQQGFRWRRRGPDGRLQAARCELDWASVTDGRVYFWQVVDTGADLRATFVAAALTQRSAQWRE